ncbi:MAG: SEC-C domain-containing protein [Candidatus Cloacimonetes bacterium]|nr:SEC-C domain-containing protein [Candidatus Cloacimonadota bacterium]
MRKILSGRRCAAKISRNAPCPCGSGQKYKKYCLPKEDSQDFSYRRISQTFQSLTGKLMTFA